MEIKLKKRFQGSSIFGMIRKLKIMSHESTMITAETSKMSGRGGSRVFRYVKVNYPYLSRIQPNFYGPRRRRPCKQCQK